MSKNIFKLHNPFQPAGDQPAAISKLVEGLKKGMKRQTLLGATGTGKTFTMANVIAQFNKPTLVIAHNKTLAAQLAQELFLTMTTISRRPICPYRIHILKKTLL